MEDITTEQMIIVLVVVAAVVWWLNRRPDKEGRLPDLAVTRSKVLEILKAFVINEGVTREADVQKQLLHFLQDKFHHVQSQKPIGGVYAKQIDFDIGRERVGVEIKMAKSLLKKTEFDRLHGQMKSYSDAYPDDNLILLVFATSTELRDRVKQTKLKEAMEDFPVYHEFIELPT